jgi:hypothetical protein
VFPKCHSTAKLPSENGTDTNNNGTVSCNSTIAGIVAPAGGGNIAAGGSGGPAAATDYRLCFDMDAFKDRCDPNASQCCTTNTPTSPAPGIRETQFFARERPRPGAARPGGGAGQEEGGRRGGARPRAARRGPRAAARRAASAPRTLIVHSLVSTAAPPTRRAGPAHLTPRPPPPARPPAARKCISGTKLRSFRKFKWTVAGTQVRPRFDLPARGVRLRHRWSGTGQVCVLVPGARRRGLAPAKAGPGGRPCC